MVVLIGLMKLSATIKDDNKVTSLSFQTSISMKQFIVLCLVAFVLPACHKGKIKRKACSYPLTQTQFGSGYLSIPNIFTPDGDGQFDVWQFQHDGIAEFSLRVEDRVGRTQWMVNDPNEVWEGISEKGKLLEGVLFYQVAARAESGEWFHEYSYVTVIRDTEKLCPKNLDDCVFQSSLTDGRLQETGNSETYKASFPCR